MFFVSKSKDGFGLNHITSKDNKGIKEYIKLARSRSYREETGCFALETVKLVQEALDSGVNILRLYAGPELQKNRPDLLEQARELGTEINLISPELEEKMTQTGNSRGCFAVCKRLDKLHHMDTIGKKGRFLFLNGLQDNGNVGTILRTAEALGVDGVILSRDCCDLFALKTLRAAMGSAFRIPVYRSEDPRADLLRLGERFLTCAAVVGGDARPVTEAPFGANVILVIGNEGNGLPEEISSCCRLRITIPMAGKAESLNAAMAAGILTWEMLRRPAQLL